MNITRQKIFLKEFLKYIFYYAMLVYYYISFAIVVLPIAPYTFAP